MVPLATTARKPLFIEVIASTLEEAIIADQAGASRIELAIDLQRGGLTPPATLVQSVVSSINIPTRVMLREGPGFEIASISELDTLVAKARELSRIRIDGFVTGFLKGGELHLDALHRILAAAPATPFTFHNALERSSNLITAVDQLRQLPQFDTLLIHGHGDTPEAALASLTKVARRWTSPQRSLLINGYAADDIARLHPRFPFATSFHFGSQVRTPALPYPQGHLDRAKIAATISLINSAPH
ncbi:MAG TPA: copper homeostasis protein CutC [Edaphobacter sp.]